MSKELFSIIKEDGHCNINFRTSLDKLTREEFNQVIKMTYYALKLLEENIVNNEVDNEVKSNE